MRGVLNGVQLRRSNRECYADTSEYLRPTSPPTIPEALLLTGATGYIASHTWVALLEAGYQVIGLDNLCNSNRVVVERIAAITGKTPHFVEGDARDRALLEQLLASYRIAGAIHFAALKAVGVSVAQRLAYYDNNLNGLLTLCSAMQAAGVRQLVFSSSATVYGNPQSGPILEDFPLSATNPYGQIKLMGEQFCATWSALTRPSALPTCVTSTRSARTKAA